MDKSIADDINLHSKTLKMGFMKFFTTLLICLLFVSGYSQTTLLQEGFEGDDFPPAGWEVLTSSAIDEAPIPNNLPNFWDNWFHYTTDIWGDPGYIHKGLKSAAVGGCQNSPDTQYSWLVTNTLDLPDDNLIEVKYWMWYMSATPEYFTHFYILIQEDGDDKWHELEHIYHESNTNLYYVEEMSVDMSSYRNKSVKVAFVHNSTYQFAMDDISIISDNSADISEFSTNENILNIFPNPSSGIIQIDLDANNNSYGKISVLDLSGKSVIEKTETNINKTTIDCSNLSPGMYFVEIRQASKIYRKQFILQ